jgi:hypothetical protein
MQLEARNFDQQTFDLCDAKGIERLVDMCERCGLKVLGDGRFWKYGDVPIDLGDRASMTMRVGNDELRPSPVAYLEAEMRGVESQSPWATTGKPEHPYKFRFGSASVVGRKAETPLSLLQVSFDGPNATIVLMSDAANPRWWEPITTTRGDDVCSRPPLHLVVVAHQNENGDWLPCQFGCNPAEEDGTSQRIIKGIFWRNL